MLEVLADYLALEATDRIYEAAFYVLSQNLVHGDALTMRTSDDQAIVFAEWGYLGKGKYQRRDFRLDALAQMSTLHDEGRLVADRGKHEVFVATKTYPPLTVSNLALAGADDAAGGTR